METETTISNKTDQYFTFYLKDELFCIEVAPIKEIIEYLKITRVPMMQSFIMGITNIRGNVIPVIDLSDRLGLGKTEIVKKTCIVIVQAKLETTSIDIGILIDSINQVIDITTENIEKAPEFGSKIKENFINRMIKFNKEFIDVLNLDTILDIKELAEIEKS